ncbi:ABC transporter ATP-binding protein [Lactococcus carnosus]|uniref:ABC transporter ATP-binding protein n=1 Tax=Pseudolactococcus carnosus TaxID=2749961 RepID=UPI0008128AEA|nr:ABC transporter ATP-binding protein [Lactococcus carnosus]SCA92647.1 putative ABC transporter, transmembrane domain, type 1 [Lactococcus piscium]MCJ1969709.1 ABC transporter ATP-binding protein [Lactococcus carnosus]MCJ1973257.1 ABC transporter ATP-binding protein [Lactococcus carnosus]MCJ1975314.1 ABC transporter ATP-binding protein [Lactococcus carnosus]MCJ1978987.1 ABC transporter ATP-binding protein [Lactococcus carnosus]
MTKTKNTSSLGFFLPYLMAFRLELVLSILCGLASGTTVVLMTYYIGISVDQMAQQGQVNFAIIQHVLSLFLGVLVVTVISQLLIQRLSNRLAYRSIAALRKDTFTHLNQLPLRYYDQTAHGDIVSRFTNDMDNISSASAAVFNQLFSGVTVVIIALGFMLYLSPVLTLVVLISTPIIFLVSWLVARASQQDFVSQQRIIGTISGYITEMIGNQKTVKAFQREAINQSQFESLNQELYVKGQKAQFSSSLTNPLSRFVDHLAYLSVGCVGGLLVLQGSTTVTIGVISSFTIYASQFTKPFIEISGITVQIQTAFAGLKRTQEIMDQPIELADSPDARVLDHAKGEIDFREVSFGYNPKQPLITDFSLTVAPGEMIAIVGKTGAGKSTLINLLMRFYDVDKGSIEIDGTDIRDLTRDSLRQSFGMVLQETWLFGSSLRANLRYGRKSATDEDIYAALKAVYMYDFVMRLPDKLDTEIGEHALKLSEGQRQLLTIARTMISEPQMLILDEATSAVDTLTEQKIQKAFMSMMVGRTSFIIAHRLSTIKNADKILVLNQGQIVEIGSHDALMQQQGYYFKLQQAQFAQ